MTNPYQSPTQASPAPYDHEEHKRINHWGWAAVSLMYAFTIIGSFVRDYLKQASLEWWGMAAGVLFLFVIYIGLSGFIAAYIHDRFFSKER